MPLADDRVAFPVAGAPLLVNLGGALGDVPAVRDAAPPGGSRRLAAALAPALAQEDVELATAGAVLVDPLVEPGKADRDDAAAFQPAGNLLGAPVQQQQGAHDVPDRSRQLARARRRQATALLGLALGLLVAVAGLAGVAAQLAADSRFVASQLACDLADRDPLLVQSADLATLVVLQMAVALSHLGSPCPGPRPGPGSYILRHDSHPTPTSCVALPCTIRTLSNP